MQPAAQTPAPSLDALLDDLVGELLRFRPRAPHEQPFLLGGEVAVPLAELHARVARGQGALDVAMGEALAALAEADPMRLGYRNAVDYARQRLGISRRTVQGMVRLARALRERPLLREAVRRGEVTARKAQAVLPVARGEDEAAWVERARRDTVRALESEAREKQAPDVEDAEPLAHLRAGMTPEERATWEEALALARKLVGAGAPRWQLLEAIAQEFLSERPVEVPAASAAPQSEARMDAVKRALEAEMVHWDFLAPPSPVAAPPPPEDGRARALDAALRRMVEQRARWDLVFGQLSHLARRVGLWRWLGFASFDHYAEELLGMSGRAVEQRAALEDRLTALPELRQALCEGRLSYEKVRLLARVEDPRDWIGRAAGMTCVALERALDAEEERQACARRELRLRLPLSVALLVRACVRAIGAAEGRPVPAGECLARMARHFVDTWGPALAQKSTPERRARARDVPGWGHHQMVSPRSAPGGHAHHVLYRSRGGGDDVENLCIM